MNQQHNRSYKTLIPCNLYGKYDDFDLNKSHMIPGVIRRMQEAKEQAQETMTIWGSGETRREFMYAEDLADFISYYIDKIDSMPEMMNIGLGTDYSIDEYYQAISKVVNYNGVFDYDLTKPEGMKRKQVDITEQTKMNWTPKHSLIDGLTKTYQYYMEMEI
jgi:GDP-L-fucose synthase